MQVGTESARCAAEPVRPSFTHLERSLEVTMLFGLILAVAADSAVIRNLVVAPAETLRVTLVGHGQPVVVIPGLLGSAYA